MVVPKDGGAKFGRVIEGNQKLKKQFFLVSGFENTGRRILTS